MEKFTELLQQRRVWAGIVGVLAVIFSLLGLDYIEDQATLIDLLSNTGIMLAKAIEAIGALVSAGLALWSYIKPKKHDTEKKNSRRMVK